MAGTLAENDWPAPRSDGEFHCFDLSCPSLACSKNKLSGLLRHVRESHPPSDIPSWFVRKWRLQACPLCHFFFKELSKHTKCGGKTSVQRQALASASAEGGDNVATCALVVANASVGVAVGDSAGVAASAAVGVAASDGVVAGGAPVAPGEQLSGRDTGVGADGAFAERESWGLVEGLSWDDILQRCPSTVLGIKDHLKAVWQQAMMIPLRALSANIADEGAWKLLFLLPSMLLARNAQRGGKKGSGEIKRKFKRFLAYQWAPLLVSKDGRRVNHSDSSPEAVRQGILKKVESCVREGDISRAARLLTSSGLAPDSAETLQRLKAKHPQSSVPLSSPCDDSAGPITLERESFLKALKSTPRGSAPGPSGLRFEHLKVCSEVRDLCDCLCGIVQKVAAGGPGPVVGRALASARLIALAKGGGDVRPIAVGEVLRRLVARSICIQERATMADIFSPVQYGVATPGGLDQVVHQIQAGLEAHSDWGVFKCDLRNAFNSVSRQAFFNETLQFLPSIMPFTRLLYGQPSPLI